MSDFAAIRFDALLYLCNIVVANLPSARFRLLFYRRFMQVEMAPGDVYSFRSLARLPEAAGDW